MRVTNAHVTAVVQGGSPPAQGPIELEPMTVGGAQAYGGFATLPPRDRDRIKIEVVRPGVGAVQAVFSHQHLRIRPTDRNAGGLKVVLPPMQPPRCFQDHQQRPQIARQSGVTRHGAMDLCVFRIIRKIAPLLALRRVDECWLRDGYRAVVASLDRTGWRLPPWQRSPSQGIGRGSSGYAPAARIRVLPNPSCSRSARRLGAIRELQPLASVAREQGISGSRAEIAGYVSAPPSPHTAPVARLPGRGRGNSCRGFPCLRPPLRWPYDHGEVARRVGQREVR